jgi:hypothetical protein
MKNKQILEELLSLSNEINKAISEAVSLEENETVDKITKHVTGHAKNIAANPKKWAARELKNAGYEAGLVKDKIENKVLTSASDINKKGLATWAKERANARMGGNVGTRVADSINLAKTDPKAWVGANKTGLAATGAAGVAGVAALGAGIYTAKKMAQHKRWLKNGCDSIVDASEKLRCKNYVASKKA